MAGKFTTFLAALLFAGTLCAAEGLPPPVVFTVTDFEVTGSNPLSAATTTELLQQYLGDHEGLDGLLAAAEVLEQAILSAGHSFHRVILPPQTLQSGAVKLEVITYTVGEVRIQGNRHFSAENIRASLPLLAHGTIPDTRLLSGSLALANKHPNKNLTLTFAEGAAENTVDARIRVQDSKPWQVYSSFNNTGSEETGSNRITVGAQHNNLFGRDYQIGVSYTTSPTQVSDVRQIGLTFKAPLYRLGGEFHAYYVRSDVDTGVVAQFFDVSGSGSIGGLSYTQTLTGSGPYSHSIRLGIDDKLFDNNIDFVGTPIGIDVRTRPVTLTYQGHYQAQRGQLRFSAEVTRNLSTGSHNDQATYAATREGADVNWSALDLSANGSYTLWREWQVRGVLSAQVANEALVAGEQFSLGGVNSVRGFEESEVVGDNGIRASLEIWAPPMKHKIRLLGFVDLGHIERESPQPGEISNDTLSGAGIGLRWQWKNHVHLLADVGVVINGARGSDSPGSLLSRSGDKKAHFNLFVSY